MKTDKAQAAFQIQHPDGQTKQISTEDVRELFHTPPNLWRAADWCLYWQLSTRSPRVSVTFDNH
jgi:hypothetical protein